MAENDKRRAKSCNYSICAILGLNDPLAEKEREEGKEMEEQEQNGKLNNFLGCFLFIFCQY